MNWYSFLVLWGQFHAQNLCLIPCGRLTHSHRILAAGSSRQEKIRNYKADNSLVLHNFHFLGYKSFRKGEDSHKWNLWDSCAQLIITNFQISTSEREGRMIKRHQTLAFKCCLLKEILDRKLLIHCYTSYQYKEVLVILEKNSLEIWIVKPFS